ncbi:hypothetical protein GCM10022382_04190 [Microbacterium invictum]
MIAKLSTDAERGGDAGSGAGMLTGMARRPRPLPDALGDAFSVEQARVAGVSSGRLRGSDLLRPFRGTRMRPICVDDDTSDDDVSPMMREANALQAEIGRRAQALATVAPPAWVFTHATAAVLWGLPMPLHLLRLVLDGEPRAAIPPRGLDIATLDARRAPRGSGMCGHQLKSTMVSVRSRHGLRVADPAGVWAQLAPLLTIDELIAIGDAIVHIPRRRGMKRGTSRDALGTPAELAAALVAGRREGIGKLREALPRIRVGSASPGETRIRLAVVRAGLPEPDLDVDVVAADGTPIGYTELAYPRWRLLVEYEGDHHRVSRAQWNRDIEKHAACAAEGLTVIRLTSAHAYPSTGPAVRRIRDALQRAGWHP